MMYSFVYVVVGMVVMCTAIAVCFSITKCQGLTKPLSNVSF